MKICPICKKGSQMSGKFSNRVRATKFNPTGKKRKYPNLQWAKLPDKTASAGWRRIKICTVCLKQNRHLSA